MKQNDIKQGLQKLLPGLALSLTMAQGAIAAPIANDQIASTHPVLNELLSEAPITFTGQYLLADYEKCHDRYVVGPFEFGKDRRCQVFSPLDDGELAQLKTELDGLIG